MNVAVRNFRIFGGHLSVALFWRKSPDFKIHSIDISSLAADSFTRKILKEKQGYPCTNNSKTKEGGLSSPPIRGLDHSHSAWQETPRSVEEKIHRDYYKIIFKACPETGKYFSEMDSFFNGKIKALPLKYLFLERLSPFQKKILCELRNKVPAGRTISYSGLAELAGCPEAARAVGTVMSSNPFPLVFPCHRVVKSDGSVGCFQGGEHGIPLKKMLLKLEIKFSS
ncbi:MAG TPA: hypothetical protein DCZ94_11660 [Lentisphaeria bacterium]|nr:MAG: hypothetical protein A2X48_00450 [Lentisphaerae bacterium GWF2_49_21]HBC87603.1 hypothetical protein [Lentisphaeria bacterium]